jgi:hypothetical protein
MVLYQLASAHYVSQALYVAAHLGIADFLADGPKTHQTLAVETATHAASLHRVLRLLASAAPVRSRRIRFDRHRVVLQVTQE